MNIYLSWPKNIQHCLWEAQLQASTSFLGGSFAIKVALQLTNSSVTCREKLLEEAELFCKGPGTAKAENTHVHRAGTLPVIATLGCHLPYKCHH